MSSGPHAAVQPEYVASAPYPTECIAFAVRAAAEGVPVGVIARAIGQPYDRVLAYLQRAKAPDSLAMADALTFPPALPRP